MLQVLLGQIFRGTFIVKPNSYWFGQFFNRSKKNLEQVKASVSSESWNLFKFIQGDVCNFDDCKMACSNVDYVPYQAALDQYLGQLKTQ